MPTSVETPENNVEADKALLVAELLLAEEMGDLTSVIIQNAAASIDLAKKTADLIAANKAAKDAPVASPVRTADPTGIKPVPVEVKKEEPKPVDLGIFDSPGHEVDKTPYVPTPLPPGAPGAGTAGNPFPLPSPPNPGTAGNPFPLPGFEAKSPTPPLPPPPGSPATSFPALNSSTPALGKPQPVIVVGPKPLPVSVIGPIESTPKKEPPEEKEKKGPDFGQIIADSLVGVLRGVLSGNFGQVGSSLAQGTGKAVTAAAVEGGAEAGPAGAAGAAVAAVAEKLVGVITGPADAIRAKFESVIGPAAVLAATLNSTTAGFQVVAKVTTLLGTVLGAVFLPFTFALAVAVFEVAEILKTALKPAFGELFKSTQDLIAFFLTVATALGLFATAVIRTASAMVDVAKFLNHLNPLGGDETLDEVKKKLDAFGAGVEVGTADIAKAAARAAAIARGDPLPGGGGAGGGAIGKILEEFRRSFGPQASFSGIADVGKQIQLAALNKSPIDAEILKTLTEFHRDFVGAARGGAAPPVAPIGGRGAVRGPHFEEREDGTGGGGGDF
jgi:hypothetical protein